METASGKTQSYLVMSNWGGSEAIECWPLVYMEVGNYSGALVDAPLTNNDQHNANH